MSKVVVVNADPDNEPSKPDQPDGGSNRFETWVPVNYMAGDLKRDVACHWRLNPSKFELRDEQGNVLAEFTRVALSMALHPPILTLHRVDHAPASPSESPGRQDKGPGADPFAVRGQVFDLFVLFALQNPPRNGQLALTKHQFKQLLQRAAVFPKKRKLEFETSVELALKRSMSSNRTGEASVGLGVITFDGFLDALLTVARLLFPKARPDEVAFEQLLRQHLFPYLFAEQQIGKGYPSWSTISVFMTGKRVEEVVQRLRKPIADLAEIYSSTPSSLGRTKSLTFHDFRRFVCDLKPKELHMTTAELSKIFLHFFRLGASAIDDGVAVPSMSDLVGARGSSWDVEDGDSLVMISCKSIMSPLGAIAWLAMTRLIPAKRLSGMNSQLTVGTGQPLSGKMRARVLKSLFHHIALHLRDKSSIFTVKSAAHSLAQQRFLLELERMHREDNLEDYQHEFLRFFQQQGKQSKQKKQQQKHQADITTPSDQQLTTSEAVSTSPDTPDEFAFLDAVSTVFEECDSKDSELTLSEPVSTEQETPAASQQDNPNQGLALYGLIGACNEADEMYAFLASELLRHSMEKREANGDRMVEPMLDVWAAAGEKYSQVIAQLTDPTKTAITHRRADTFSRWGVSLEVFAVQVLKHTTTVYEYEALFGITNPRVFSVASKLWSEISSLFVADLALESLSLASAKLSRAAEEYYALLGGDTYCAQDAAADEDGDGCDSGGESDDGDDEGSNRGTSAYYEKYLASIFHRANCLVLYGDMLAHGKAMGEDYQLGCTLEEECDFKPAATSSPTFFGSSEVLTKTSSCGMFYNEARKMYAFLLTHSGRHKVSEGGGSSYSLARLYRNLGAVQFRLAALIPQGCVVEGVLLEASLANAIAACRGCTQQEEGRPTRESRVVKYIRAAITVHQSFFLPEAASSEHGGASSRDTRSLRGSEERIVPFYRFILAAAFREVDTKGTGELDEEQLSAFNALVKRGGEVSSATMGWLLENFDSQSAGLTERGFLCYFCWLAEADPIAFNEILEQLTSKYTDTHQSAISSTVHSNSRILTRATSLRPKAFVDSTSRLSRIPSDLTLQKQSPSIAEGVVVLSGKLHHDALMQLCSTRSPSEVQLEPEVVEVLPSRAKVPEELSKFCFPDAMFLSSEWRPPHHFDVVLTDIKGSMLYASCLHYLEERDPMDILALISSADQRGGKTADLPPWISLKDIQQGRTKWRCFLPVCICVLSSVPLFKTFQRFLFHTYRLLQPRQEAARTVCETPESLVYQLLQQIHLPLEPGAQTAFKFGGQTCLIPALAPGSPLFYPTEVEFSILFQCLSIDHIIKVYGFLLTEKKVVLCARNKAVLTHVAETFRALLHPFEFQHVYIPLLPISLLDFVMAPVPFFMGIGSDVGSAKFEAEGVVVVDLDANEVRVPTNEAMPSLPESKTKKLVNLLRKITASSANWTPGSGPHQQTAQPQQQAQQPSIQAARSTFGALLDSQLGSLPSTYSPSQPTDGEVMALSQANDELTDKWAEIQGVFTASATRLIKDVRKFCSRAASPVRGTTPNGGSSCSVEFDARGFLAVHQGMRDFCSQLFQTQLFQRFLDNFDAVADLLNLPDADQNWRGVRTISSLRKHLADSTASSSSDDPLAKPPLRLFTRAPLPALGSSALDGSGPSDGRRFDAARYETLVGGERAAVQPSRSSSSLLALSQDSPPRKVSASTFGSSLNLSDSLLVVEDTSPSSLVSEARRRLTEKQAGIHTKKCTG